MNPYPTNPLFEDVTPPPVAEARSWVAGRSFPAHKPLIDVSQAVPGYPPPLELTRHVARLASEPHTARYTEIAGLLRLRSALAADLSRTYQASVEAEQVLITAGCNQAFCLALLALARAGDQVLLPLPYYFNHHMWLAMLGVEAVPLPFRSDRGGVPDPAEARRKIDRKTRAIVLVTPNNPTGAVYPPAVMDEFYELAAEHGIALVVDETYRDFLPHSGPAHTLFERPDWPHTLIQLYSFSKVYCLTGYRVGSLVCGAALASQVLKAMDCVAICAPHLGQEAALFGLEHLDGWRREKRELLSRRVEALSQALDQPGLDYELVSAGAYFAYVRHPLRDRSCLEVARRLATEEALLTLPGSMFGPHQEPYLRFAFGNVDTDTMPEIARRLVRSQDWPGG